MTLGTYPWTFVAQIFHSGQPTLGSSSQVIVFHELSIIVAVRK